MSIKSTIRKLIGSNLFWLAIIAMVLLGPVVAKLVYYQGIAPVPQASIEECLESTSFTKIVEIQKDGQVFFVATGESPPVYVAPSGPPVYVFDSRGVLVDWIWDSGDAGTAMSPWNASMPREVSLAEVLTRTRAPPP